MSERDDLFGAYADAVGGPDAMASERMERELMGRLGRHDAQKVSRLRWVAGASVLAAAAAILVLFLSWNRGGAPDGGAVVAMTTSARGQTVELPHDGRLELAAHTRLHLVTDEATGATVELLTGEVLLDVNSGPGLRWRVISGEHTVEAVGTRFRVMATPAVPEVVVEEGVVRLTGPSLPADGLLIRADEREPSPLAKAEPPPVLPVPIDGDLEDIDDPGTEDGDVPSMAPEPNANRGAGKGWIARFHAGVRDGDDEATVAALPKSFPTGKEGIGAADYVDAGDALRATGDRDTAERAYETACERGPKSNACGVALLRLAISRAGAGDRRRAIELASRYLDEHPDGTLARDALGRRMQWRWKSGDEARARGDAQVYLQRWPRGSRAEFARSILQP